ncbi:MAG: RagB/SusD family nutrient uptake outer membrane protein [Tannerellaceae bacterium]|nr:RagB/SusD family nutrient uptake outer membrane protein [Tannerellaceae bacterium]
MNRFIAILMLFSGLFTSCNDFLQKSPLEELKVDTEEKVRQVLVNAYPTTHWAYMSELASDEADDLVFFTNNVDDLPKAFYLWEDCEVTGKDSPQALWHDYYNAIAHANLALETIAEMGEPEALLPYKGEALICRAFCHFILVNLFCKHYHEQSCRTDAGIPYMLATEKNGNARYDRGTVGEVYSRIEKDIIAGLPLLDDHAYTVPKYQFNTKAAMAFACRFYLYKGDFEQVIVWSSQILGSNPGRFLRNWSELGALFYTDYERIKNYSGMDADCNLMLGSFQSNWSTSGCMTSPLRLANNALLQQTEGMHRSGLWGAGYEALHVPGAIVPLSYQFVVYKIGSHPGNLMLMPLFTMEEMLLNRAEAYVRISDEKGADYLNLALDDISTLLAAYSTQHPITREMVEGIYGSSMEYYTWDTPTPKKALDATLAITGERESFIHGLLHLRRSVFIHEGFRWFDIKRYGIEIYRREIEEGQLIRQTDFLSRKDERRAFQLPPQAIHAGMQPNPR